MRLVAQVKQWLEEHEVFERERTKNGARALAIVLYNGGLSLALAGHVVGRSAEAVSEWVDKTAQFFRSRPAAARRRIACDEKKISVRGREYWLFAALDLDSGEPLAVLVTGGRSCFEAYAFLKKVKARCQGRLPRVFTDGGTFYPWALKRLGFHRHTVIPFGPRSPIEGFFSVVQRRIVRFCGYFPHRSTRESTQRWMEAFAGGFVWRRRLS